MAGFSSSAAIILAAVLAVFIYTAELSRAPFVLGVGRQKASTPVSNPNDFHTIADTVHCEDIHYHEPSNLLFTACEGTESTRYGWFPGLGHLDDPTVALKAQGVLEVIDPRTMKAKRLEFTNFNGPFVTHGIDVIDDPEKPIGEAVYIFAVNHVPSAAYSTDKTTKEPKARSIIEVFHHVVGSHTVDHIRSVWDPLITTPNDIVAVSPTSFFVTNDHYYREGFLRTIETVFFGAKWTNIIHVEFTELTDGSFRDDDHGVKASVAMDGLHNGNGLGHGRTATEILIVSCASGRVHIGEILPAKDGKGPPTIAAKESVIFESILDNPSWFRDPYAQKGYDASGVVSASLSRGIDLGKNSQNPQGDDGVIVWMATPTGRKTAQWETKLLFEDDSTRIRTASAAVLVAIDPAQEQGKRKAWLFVTGFMSKSVVAVKVDL
ncbi:hypothetical protein QQS21_000352 [Conoideocrella luteorostrata]|uniref:Serum paraoxonase/arylesterase family protein n=1 Tax=Conoideocrella luteorostrata TaxID=1105319 RepID=A0AAJ0D1E9_9HYPO|nr:hypothetical protein QQS21_000352 [Conoideocrella luteorostrata]